MKPRMSTREVKLIERALLRAGKDGRTVNVLEWGSGGSTVYFTKYMRVHSISYTWESIEYNKKWLKKVEEALGSDKNTHIAFFDVGNEELKQRQIPMNEYVEHPRTLEKRFDVVIVDGRKRRRCLLEAQKFIKADGAVFLHDAQRTYYHSSFGVYANNSFISCELWRGNNQKPTTLSKIKNRLRSFFYTFIFKVCIYPARKTVQHVRGKYRLTRDTLRLLARPFDRLKVLYALLVMHLPILRKDISVQVGGQGVTLSSTEYTNGVTLYNLLKRAHDLS